MRLFPGIEKNHIPKLGIIPGGTGNLITKLLEINQNIDQAIEELDFNFTKTIDVGKANQNYFGYIFSVGSLPEAIHNVDIEDKTKYGIFSICNQYDEVCCGRRCI